jgi:hypothetical protein
LQAELFGIFAHMHKMAFIITLLFTGLSVARGQGYDPGYETMEGDTAQNLFGDIEPSNVIPAIEAWQLSNHYSTKKNTPIDTATIDFHQYNPIFKKSISNNYLGFLGSPYENNQFFDRQYNTRFYFLQHLDAYHVSSEKVTYYNTTTPYASLLYNQGNQGTSRALQVFDAFFTRNIDSISNFGFRFDVIKNTSQYVNQMANHKNLNFFVSRTDERYHAYFSFLNRGNKLENNGGITRPSINVATDPFELPVNLLRPITSETKSMALFTSHEYFMGSIPFGPDDLNDNLDVGFIPRYSAQYTAELNNYKHYMNEDAVNRNFFENTYIKESNHIDSSFFTVFNHAFHLNAFENENRKFTFGKRAFIENDLVKAVHPLPYGQRIYTYSNVKVGGEIYHETGNFMTWRATANFTLLGRNIGDAKVKGEIEKPFALRNDTLFLKAEGWYSDITANIFQEHWMSNHYKWENNFKKQHEIIARTTVAYPRYHAKAGFDYALFSNYLYNNAMAMPDQFAGEFSVLSGWLYKDVHLGRFIWSNKAVWQAVSNNAVLRLPALSAYSSFSYSHYLFKVMKINLGAEVYYHTAYKANFYEPSTTRFYLQDELSTGGYPLINLYANAKLKRTSAFAILEHANSMFGMGQFFSTPRYPLEQMAFRFGFLWTFYD